MEDIIIKLIKDWSQTFGAPVSEELGHPAMPRQNLCYKLIHEELMEFDQAQTEEDLKAIQDALGDLLWVVVRAMMEYGIEPEKCINAIYRSNMSKLDYSEKDAEESVMAYAISGIEAYYEKHPTKNCFIIKRKVDDKILKSHKFVEPIFN